MPVVATSSCEVLHQEVWSANEQYHGCAYGHTGDKRQPAHLQAVASCDDLH